MICSSLSKAFWIRKEFYSFLDRFSIFLYAIFMYPESVLLSPAKMFYMWMYSLDVETIHASCWVDLLPAYICMVMISSSSWCNFFAHDYLRRPNSLEEVSNDLSSKDVIISVKVCKVPILIFKSKVDINWDCLSFHNKLRTSSKNCVHII